MAESSTKKPLYQNFIAKLHERKIYRITLVSIDFIHLVYLLFFMYIGATLMTVFNVASVIFYSIFAYLAGKSDLRIIGSGAYIEIIIHAILATLTLGWQYGFTMTMICIIPLAYFIPYKNTKTPVILCLIPAFLFLVLKFFSSSDWFVPYRKPELGTDFINVVYMFNSIVSFFMIIMLSVIYNVSSKKYIINLENKNEKLREFAYTDPLTKLQNRRSMYRSMEKSFIRAKKSGESFSIILSDIDDFKVVNDTHGHNAGDKVLVEISKIYMESVPENASVCRWGGEEIMVLIPDCKVEDAAEIADMLRRKIMEREFSDSSNKSLRATMTFGVSENKGQFSIDKMISNADRNLYSGKRSGKNCVVY